MRPVVLVSLFLGSNFIKAGKNYLTEPTLTNLALEWCRVDSCGHEMAYKNFNWTKGSGVYGNKKPFFLKTFKNPGIINFSNGKCSESMKNVKINEIVNVEGDYNH